MAWEYSKQFLKTLVDWVIETSIEGLETQASCAGGKIESKTSSLDPGNYAGSYWYPPGGFFVHVDIERL
jgi:hypothetical protein